MGAKHRGPLGHATPERAAGTDAAQSALRQLAPWPRRAPCVMTVLLKTPLASAVPLHAVDAASFDTHYKTALAMTRRWLAAERTWGEVACSPTITIPSQRSSWVDTPLTREGWRWQAHRDVNAGGGRPVAA